MQGRSKAAEIFPYQRPSGKLVSEGFLVGDTL